MKIKNASFEKSSSEISNCPNSALFEIAFIGRSNVGKSSLLNMLLNKKSIAKVSKIPGKTKLINYFLVNNDMYFVDLPGYGYAKLSKKSILTINKIIEIIDNSKTILWNGPAGYFENPNFANGSIKIAKKIVENNKSSKIFSVVGGGDTVSLLNSLKIVGNFNFVSTAGGAFLEYLEGKKLPGITALN